MENQGGTSGPRVSDKRLAQTQAKVDEVVGIMRVNVEKVLERDQKLSELDNRADALQHGAAQFEQQAGKLKRKYWWQNLKMMLIIGGIGLVLVIIIIVWATSGSGGSSNSAPAPTVAPPAAPPASEPGR
ncbi:synaptobrevin-1-like [Melitaea cinxia]|uniref:synaptobrevin-1-like n=1 Tax=Melitaea cinxia TaxID=113334 RepID=UPI001E272462|nr:synaptobrevin-1-like [Melitaea cinxia]